MINHINYTFTPPSPIRFGHSEEDTLTEEDKRFFRNCYGNTQVEGDDETTAPPKEGHLLDRIAAWHARQDAAHQEETDKTVALDTTA